jgi:proteasome lid subunit RPN8/RPN11
MNISGELRDEIVEHALENPKIECCGLVAVESGPDGAKTAMRVYRTENIHASALKFEIDPMEQYRVTSEPKPSQTDISFAAHAGPIEWIIVGLAAGAEPDVRSYLIEDGKVREVPLEVR